MPSRWHHSRTAAGVFTGHIGVQGVSNVIVKNLKLVGLNCTDGASCEDGSDALTIERSAHHPTSGEEQES